MSSSEHAGQTEQGARSAETRVGGQEMSQRVEAVLGASGLRGPALASLEGASGLFALTEEQLLFHDSHGTRRVTLRDLARIHSDAEGTLRVETPAGVAMSASLIGYDGDEVQQFFGQVRDVTARVKSLTPPPMVTPAPRAPEPAPRRAPAPRPEAPQADPDEGVSVTAVRRPESEEQHFSGPPPKITVNRGGRREELSGDGGGMRENGLGLGTVGQAPLDRHLPPPGSVEIRAVRTPGRPPAPAPQPVMEQPEDTWQPGLAPSEHGAEHAPEFVPVPETHSADAPQSAPLATPVQPAPAQAAPPAPKPKYTEADLSTQASKVRGVPGRLRLLGVALFVGAVITAILMFANAQRLLALWVMIAGIVGLVALLSAAELAQLQAIQADVLAGRDEAQDEPGPLAGDEAHAEPEPTEDALHPEATPERHG